MEKEVTILSLFDGMSCGMIAMQNAGLKVKSYDAYEIDKYAIKVSKHNFPSINQHGDVFSADFTKYNDVDYLIGGSPCFTQGHLVLTDKGYKDISDIKIGDMVLTHKNRFRPVTKLYERKSQTVALEIFSTPPFVTTKNHPFYTIEQNGKFYNPTWTETDRLTKNHLCGTHLEHPPIMSSIPSDISLWMLGAYVACGSIWDGLLHFCIKDDLKEKFREKLKDLKPNEEIIEKIMDVHGETIGTEFSIRDDKFLKFIFVNNVGTGFLYNDKWIPFSLFGENKERIKEFFYGLSFGYETDDDGNRTYMAPIFREALIIQKLYQFAFESPAKISENLDIYKINPETDDYEPSAPATKYPCKVTFLDEKQYGKNFDTYDKIAWFRALSKKEKKRPETVYNIEVSEDNSYTINNFIVHNCTYWSIAQKNHREVVASGMGWDLFCQYVRALREAKPKYFIYENNKSMSDAIRESISSTFGFEPVYINSSLLSAQNRKRLYWVGKRNEDGTYSKVDVEQPEDKNIILKEILDYGAIPLNTTTDGKAGTIRATCYKDGIRNLVGNNIDKRTCVAYSVEKNKDPRQKCYYPEDNVGEYETVQKSIPYLTERLGYMPVMFNAYNRVEIKDKSHTLTTGSLVTSSCAVCKFEPICQFAYTEATRKELCKDNKIYEVKNGEITIKDKKYPIKLPDGYYIIRKMTVEECKKLQTIPEWFDFSVVSNAQAHKMIGNGWTCDVITHLINATQK